MASRAALVKFAGIVIAREVHGPVGGLGVLAHLAEHQRGEIEWGHAAPEDRVRDARAEVALELEEDMLGVVGHRACLAADHHVVDGLERHRRRGDRFAFPVADQFRDAVGADAGHDRGRGAEVDAEKVGHP